MKRAISATLAALAFAVSTAATGAGLSYSVSLEKAKQLVKTDSSKHILVFYTEGW